MNIPVGFQVASKWSAIYFEIHGVYNYFKIFSLAAHVIINMEKNKMKLLKKHTEYSLYLIMMFFANNAFSSAYYNMHFINNSNTAKVTFKRIDQGCMYSSGPSPIELEPQKDISFDVEDSNNIFSGCHDETKFIHWSVEYSQGYNTNSCIIMMDHNNDDIDNVWRTYFLKYKECNLPIKLICDGSEQACKQNGLTGHHKQQLTVEIN
ncbi:hypothetical protein [Xenorhabdus sp. BG5]|uniref:hypothetical protein n=1 Tax=Xenorhabdus sp. BG5 TaxID=2782014 RepID=UPI001882DA21|nr:hypothetical protein [Xenorhabdus sp. BG5]